MKCDGAYKELKPCSCHYELSVPDFSDYECSTWKCKRKVVAYEYGDHWCKKDLIRIRAIRAREGRSV